MSQVDIKFSQTEAIKRHLQAGKSITQLDALHLYGCLRLGARIYNLKEEGLPIVMEWVKNGRKKFASYKIAG